MRFRKHAVRWAPLLLLLLGACSRGESESHPSVVVHDVREGQGAARAGLRPGDRLHTWAAPSTNHPLARGVFRSPLDVEVVAVEIGGRGPVVVEGERDGAVLQVEIPHAPWGVQTTPLLSDDQLQVLGLPSGDAELQEERDAASWLRIGDQATRQGWHGVTAWCVRKAALSFAAQEKWDVLEAVIANVSEPARRSRIWRAIGLAAHGTSQFDEAEHAHGRSLAEVERESMRGVQALVSSAAVAYDRGQLTTAQTVWLRALATATEIAPHGYTVAVIENNLGAIAERRGRLSEAEGHYRQSLAIKKGIFLPSDPTIAGSLNNLGVVARRRGLLARAARLYHEALRLYRAATPGSEDVAMVLGNLANLALDQGDGEAARRYAAEALAIRQHPDARPLNLAFSLDGLSLILTERSGREPHAPQRSAWIAEAEDYQRRAIDIRREHAPGSLELAQSLLGLGQILRERGGTAEAASVLHEGLAIVQAVAPGIELEARLLHELGLLHRARGDHAQARALFGDAVAALEQQLVSLLPAPSMPLVNRKRLEAATAFRSKYAPFYQALLDLQVELGQETEAFVTLERSAFAEIRNLRRLRGVRSPHVAEAALVESDRLHDDHAEVIAALVRPGQTQADRADLAARRAEIEERLAQLMREQEALLQTIANPTGAPPLTVAEAQAALDPGTLVLAYAVCAERTHVFAVSSTQLRVITLPIGEAALRVQVARLRTLIDRAIPDTDDGAVHLAKAHEQAEALYATLIQPVHQLVQGAERVLIIAHGPVRLLPFAALRRPDDGQFLGVRKPLHTAPSLAAYATLRQRHADREGPVVVFGNPSAGAGQDSPLACSPPIPQTEHEVEAVAQLYEQTVTASGSAATETALRAASPGARYLHLATHAVLVEGNPLESALCLAGAHPDDETNNGLLTAWEVVEQLPLRAELVVLSGCETGLGGYVTPTGDQLAGEGPLGLTYAFHEAGATSVVSSLWSIPDEATARLMHTFHAALRAGVPNDQALQRAQAQLATGQERGRYTAPHFWAGFQLSGSWQ